MRYDPAKAMKKKMSGTCLKRRKGHSSGGGYEPYGYPTKNQRERE